MAVLLASMPCLRDVNYQPVWADGLFAPDEPEGDFNSCDLAISTLFRSVYVSSTVQDLSLWEAPYFGWSSKSLVSVAVLASYRLRNFTISNVVDAAQFFKCHETMTQGLGGLNHAYWPNLIHLCLTADRDKDNLDLLLVKAARAACEMPKLRIMEVWCPQVDRHEPTSFLFRYEVRRTVRRLTVMATSRISLSGEILTAWQRVSDLHPQHKLEYRVEFIDVRHPRCLPQFCKRLRLYDLLRDWGPEI